MQKLRKMIPVIGIAALCFCGCAREAGKTPQAAEPDVSSEAAVITESSEENETEPESAEETQSAAEPDDSKDSQMSAEAGSTEEQETATEAGSTEKPETTTEAGSSEQPAADETETQTPVQKPTEPETAGGGSPGGGISPARPEPEPPADPNAPVAITITAAGDCTLGVNQQQGYQRSFFEFYDSYGPDYFMEKVRGVFEQDDFTLINLECVLTNSNNRVDKKWNLKGKPEYTAIMTGSSIEACSHGNNHCMDYGEQSLHDTHEALDQAGILYAYNDHTAIYTTKGIRIGIVSANLLTKRGEGEEHIQTGIASLREQGAELVIVSCHWGLEGENYATDYQKAIGHMIIDWGADLIIGNHSHVLQGIEIYNGKVICYSLGNFCFGGNRNPSDKDTMMYQQTFYFENQTLQPRIDASVIPCSLSGHKGYNDFQPVIADGSKKQSILNRMIKYSAAYGTLSFDTDGKLVVTPD